MNKQIHVYLSLCRTNPFHSWCTRLQQTNTCFEIVCLEDHLMYHISKRKKSRKRIQFYSAHLELAFGLHKEFKKELAQQRWSRSAIKHHRSPEDLIMTISPVFISSLFLFPTLFFFTHSCCIYCLVFFLSFFSLACVLNLPVTIILAGNGILFLLLTSSGIDLLNNITNMNFQDKKSTHVL